MHIIRVIREANQAAAIYFLLTAYVEAITHESMPHPVPGWALQLPLRCRHDVAASLIALNHSSMWSHIAPPGHEKIAEALAVFRCALDRLELLKNAGGMVHGIERTPPGLRFTAPGPTAADTGTVVSPP